jgi:hypothetical protein
MKTNEFFKRIVCINDAAATRRWNESQYQFRTRGLNVDRIEQKDAKWLTMPFGALFTPDDLALLLTFYQVVRQAQLDGIESVLVLGDNIKLHEKFETRAEQVWGEAVMDWDLIYLGYNEVNLRDKHKKGASLTRINYGSGLLGLGINNRFYHLFLEEARLPKYSLDEHLKAISLASNIYCVNPPLIVRA